MHCKWMIAGCIFFFSFFADLTWSLIWIFKHLAHMRSCHSPSIHLPLIPLMGVWVLEHQLYPRATRSRAAASPLSRGASWGGRTIWWGHLPEKSFWSTSNQEEALRQTSDTLERWDLSDWCPRQRAGGGSQGNGGLGLSGSAAMKWTRLIDE